LQARVCLQLRKLDQTHRPRRKRILFRSNRCQGPSSRYYWNGLHRSQDWLDSQLYLQIEQTGRTCGCL